MREFVTRLSLYFVAGFLRLWLVTSSTFKLVERAELATPLNSYKRLVEGLTLMDNGVDPYSGHVFHETPLTLHLFDWARRKVGSAGIELALVLADLVAASLTASVAGSVAKSFKRKTERETSLYHPDAVEHLLPQTGFCARISERAAEVAYLFNPYLVANCAAKTTTTFNNLVLVIFLHSAVNKRPVLAGAALSLAAYQSFYPVTLLLPLYLFLREAQLPLGAAILKTLVPFSLTFAFLNYFSYKLMGDSWEFLFATHGATLSVPELTPNVGLFWYFYAEMFEHFRLFFIWTFQINCFVYVIPLSIMLHDLPFFLSWMLIALTAIFKSYPCYGDTGLYLALLPIVGQHLFPYMKQLFVAGNMFVAATVFGPVLHQMWIYNGSANSNYFFAINLVFGLAQILLVTDLLFSHMKREFYLRNGFKKLTCSLNNGHDTKLRLVLQ